MTDDPKPPKGTPRGEDVKTPEGTITHAEARRRKLEKDHNFSDDEIKKHIENLRHGGITSRD